MSPTHPTYIYIKELHNFHFTVNISIFVSQVPPLSEAKIFETCHINFEKE